MTNNQKNETVQDETADAPEPKTTPLTDLHSDMGAKLVEFAGYQMPVQFPLGVLKEHLATREDAGLFDVSHMGQAWLTGANAALALEALVPGELQGLEPGQQRYTQLLNDEGGILDDLMVTRSDGIFGPEGLFLVVNAACKEQDFAHIAAHMPDDVTLEPIEDRALIAFQGPKAASLLAGLVPDIDTMPFMSMRHGIISGVSCLISRSGYTGEDGYEISLPEGDATSITSQLLTLSGVEAVGLGARDSLRLEAGLCLYGHDIDTTTSPIEAGLLWSIGKRRRIEGGFPGAERVQREIAEGPSRRRVGLRPDGRAPAREGTKILDMDGNPIGVITSGGFSPTLGGPIAMGYVETGFHTAGTKIQLFLRGKTLPAEICKMPFVPQRYYRG